MLILLAKGYTVTRGKLRKITVIKLCLFFAFLSRKVELNSIFNINSNSCEILKRESVRCRPLILYSMDVCLTVHLFLNVSWQFLSFSAVKKVTNGYNAERSGKHLGTFEPGRINIFYIGKRSRYGILAFTLQKRKNRCIKQH